MQGLTAAKRRQVYDQSNKHCHICGDRVTFKDCQIDHIWPVEGGGNNELDNLLPSHPACNHLKWHNDPQTIQRMLFLGMLANNHGYIELTLFGQDVRAQRAKRLADNWRRRKLAELSRSANPPDPQRVAAIGPKANRLHADFLAFEEEVIREIKRIRASRKDRAGQARRGQAAGEGLKNVRESRRGDWQRALSSTTSNSRIPDRLRYAYREFAQVEDSQTLDEVL
jgi:hypothetical protein